MPGLLHTIILSTYPLNKQYRLVHGVNVDRNLVSAGEKVLTLIRSFGYDYVSVKRNVVVEGRSWEMSASKAAQGETGVYTGTVEELTPTIVAYGGVPFTDVKRNVHYLVKSNTEDRYDLLSR